MKKILFFISIAITVTFSSCTTSLTTANSVQPGVKVQTAAEADLSVKEERVSATLKGRLNKRYTLDELKENAIAKALESANADILVDPRFTITQKKGLFGKRNKAGTVSGYPAKYINIRSVKPIQPIGSIKLFGE